jgi:hypothetical protein
MVHSPSLVDRASAPAVASPFLQLGEIVRTRPPLEVARVFADLADELTKRLAESPADYRALVGLGELWLRTGRAGDAKRLLERAAFQQPPSWEAYQYVSALLRRAEVLAAKEFSRGAGAGLPGGGVLLAAIRRLFSGVRRGNG